MSVPEFGPVQMLVLGFASDSLKGEILPELKRLRDADVVRLVDLLIVAKTDDGELVVVQSSDLSPDEATAFGAIAGALIGFGAGGEDEAAVGAIAGATALEDGHVFDESEAWDVADAIPKGTTAAIALLEHRWAIPLRDKIVEAGGIALADEWIHPADLIAIGALAGQNAAVTGS
jgi:uncharacterized membrane protein